MQFTPSSVWVCLCQPNDIRNIGGALRAVANYGLAGLKIVCSQDMEWTDERLMALSSGAYQQVRLKRYESLVKATEDADLLIGTSRRRREHGHIVQYKSTDLTTLLQNSERAHVLFGNERVGLSHKELDVCHALVEIHTRPTFPSLNLAHAVACIGYELTRPQASLTDHKQTTLPLMKAQTTSSEDEAFLQRVLEVCQRSGFPPGKSAESFSRKLRSLVRRADPTPGDYGLILGVFRELDRLSTFKRCVEDETEKNKDDDLT